MRRDVLWFVIICLLATLLWKFWTGPLVRRVISPVTGFLGLSEPPRTREVSVASDADPVSAAARRLIRPLGGVRLIRTVEAPVPMEVPEPPHR